MKVGGNKDEGWTKFYKGGVNNIGGLHNTESVRNPQSTMTRQEVFWKMDVLIVWEKSLKRLVNEFIFSKVAGWNPATLQKISSITCIFEKFSLKLLSTHLFHRIHYSGCFLKLHYNLTEVLQNSDIH